MRVLFMTLGLVSALGAGAEATLTDESLQLKFQIEGGNERDSLLFVTGLSYGVSYLNKAYENAGVRVGICLPDGKEYVGAGEIVEILNKAGESSYSADDATSVVVSELAKRNPCR